MDIRVSEERMARSKSPKRYSLNRKTKEKERKQTESGTQSSCFSAQIPDGDRCGKELLCYERKRRDDSVANVQNNPQFPHAKEKKTSWAMRTGAYVSSSTVVEHSPGGFHSITNHPNNSQAPRMKLNTPSFAQRVPYANYPPHYTNQFGNFQSVQTFQPQSALQNGVCRMSIPQGNSYVHSYVPPVPVESVAGLHFSQFNMQSNEAYNAFTAYGHPFGVVWRQN